MNKSLPLAISVVLSFASVCPTVQARTNPREDPMGAVQHVLETQQDAWNRHDLDAFMAGYWNSPELTFFSAGQEQHGWQATLDRYRARYASPGHEMGKLEFSALRIEMLRPDAACAESFS